VSLPWPSPAVGVLCAPRLKATPNGALASRTLSSSLDLRSLPPRALYPYPIPATYDFARRYVHPAVLVSLLFFGFGRPRPLLRLYSREIALRSALSEVRVTYLGSRCRLLQALPARDPGPFGRSWRGPCVYTGVWASRQCLSRPVYVFYKKHHTYSNRDRQMSPPARLLSF
jgi:hypothetical protein